MVQGHRGQHRDHLLSHGVSMAREVHYHARVLTSLSKRGKLGIGVTIWSEVVEVKPRRKRKKKKVAKHGRKDRELRSDD